MPSGQKLHSAILARFLHGLCRYMRTDCARFVRQKWHRKRQGRAPAHEKARAHSRRPLAMSARISAFIYPCLFDCFSRCAIMSASVLFTSLIETRVHFSFSNRACGLIFFSLITFLTLSRSCAPGSSFEQSTQCKPHDHKHGHEYGQICKLAHKFAPLDKFAKIVHNMGRGACAPHPVSVTISAIAQWLRLSDRPQSPRGCQALH